MQPPQHQQKNDDDSSCPCHRFGSLSEIVAAIHNNDTSSESATAILSSWMIGRQPNCANHTSSCAQARATAISQFLNGLKATCAPFLLQHSKNSSEQTPAPPTIHPSHTTPTKYNKITNKAEKKKKRRRVRPVSASTTSTTNTTKHGNLVNVAETLEDDPFPPLLSLTSATMRTTSKDQQQPSTSNTAWSQPPSAPPKNKPPLPKMSTNNNTASNLDHTPRNKNNPQQPPPLQSVVTPPPPPSTPKAKHHHRPKKPPISPPKHNRNPPTAVNSSTTTTTTTNSSKCDTAALQHLVDLYSSLLDHYLVSSSILEVHWLLQLVSISTTGGKHKSNNDAMNDDGCFSTILSTPHCCVTFAKGCLQRRLPLLSVLVVVVPGLATCRPLKQHLPELSWQLQTQNNNNTTSHHVVELPVNHTALLTLPFDPVRDSRHNYTATPTLTALYKNREETRDRFLYQLRAFLTVRGKRFWSANEQNMQTNMKQSFRTILDALSSANRPWFAEFFTDMVLQLGHVPIQETDGELLSMIKDDTDKLQKLHRRFSAKSRHSRHNNNNNVAANNNCLETVVAAQQHFIGHQEFFFLFLTMTDSYSFVLHLRALLVAKIKEWNALEGPEAIRRSSDLSLLARYLGVIVFSPNWQKTTSSSNTTSVNTAAVTLDGINALTACGLDLNDVIRQAMSNSRLLATVPWVVELLKMATWDIGRRNLQSYTSLFSLLRTLQVSNVDEPSNPPLPSSVLVAMYLESLFSYSMSLSNLVGLPAITDAIAVPSSTIDSAGIPMAFLKHLGTSNVGLSSNVEDLAVLVADLSRSTLFVLKSPGISRKLRPSIVESPLPEPRNNSSTNSSATLNNVSPLLSFGKGSTFQSKLRDSFFHQHGRLKSLCEFAVGETLKTVRAQIARDCLRPVIDHAFSSDKDVDSVRRSAEKQAHRYLKESLEACVNKTLSTFVAHDTDDSVIKVAVALSVDFGVSTGEGLVANTISNEIQAAKQTLMRNERKRLFLLANNENSGNAEDSKDASTDLIASVSNSMKVVANRITNIGTESAADLLSEIESLNDKLSHCIPCLQSTIYKEETMRVFYEAILLLDDCSDALMVWTNADSHDTHRINIVHELGKTAKQLQQVSSRGLRRLSMLLKTNDALGCECLERV